MPQNIRITITPEIEEALHILRKDTLGTLNTTELIKLAIGTFAKMKKEKNNDMSTKELDTISSTLFYKWAKEDKSLDVENIAQPDKLKPFIPKQYVSAR